MVKKIAVIFLISFSTQVFSGGIGGFGMSPADPPGKSIHLKTN